MDLVDTHAHLHFDVYTGQEEAVLQRSREAGVTRILTVGVNADDSRAAAQFAAGREGVWASVGVHPHEADTATDAATELRQLASQPKVVAIGECGFDFYKSATSPRQQEDAVRAQVELALELDLPLIFHVREAFDRFFEVIGGYSGVRGVVHSFTGTRDEMERSVSCGLFVALNGIMTFTKDPSQLEAAKAVPLNRLLLETDCPFLSPAPHRGRTNEPARTADITAFLAELRREERSTMAAQTTANAEQLFGLGQV